MPSTSSSATDECTISLRSVVQRWPAVPAAENTMPRTARSRSADGVTIAALLPPSSSNTLPNRCPPRGPTPPPPPPRPPPPGVGGGPLADLAPALDEPGNVHRRANITGGPFDQ